MQDGDCLFEDDPNIGGVNVQLVGFRKFWAIATMRFLFLKMEAVAIYYGVNFFGSSRNSVGSF